MTRFVRIAALILACLTALSVFVGCAPRTTMILADEGRSYELASVAEAMIDQPDPGFFGSPTERAPDLRHASLSSLRSRGEAERQLANFLTTVFPADGRSVPYHAEAAMVDDRQAWLVAEVWGSAGGNLDRKRLWAFDRETGDVIISTSFD
ncbi:MAG: hypothetical protein U1E29_00240 [Coriobacteriia bacterium]|nr:hypothetical protein [Coriobacteriia bacterium]